MIADDQYLRIAVITGAHALKGRLKVLIVSDNLNRFKIGNSVYLKEKTGYNAYKIIDFKIQKGKMCLMQLEGIDDRNTSSSYRGIEIFITKEDAERSRTELDTNSYYYYDLIDCSVYLDRKEFAKVVDVIEAGAGELLVILSNDGKKFMIPFIEAMVNLEFVSKKRIDIYPIEGLFDI